MFISSQVVIPWTATGESMVRFPAPIIIFAILFYSCLYVMAFIMIAVLSIHVVLSCCLFLLYLKYNIGYSYHILLYYCCTCLFQW